MKHVSFRDMVGLSFMPVPSMLTSIYCNTIIYVIESFSCTVVTCSMPTNPMNGMIMEFFLMKTLVLHWDMMMEFFLMKTLVLLMPTNPMNGMITLGDDGVLSYEDTCTATCDTGYMLTGDERTCQSDGMFNGTEAMCNRGKLCACLIYTV